MSEYDEIAPSEGNGAETAQFVTSGVGEVSQTPGQVSHSRPPSDPIACLAEVSATCRGRGNGRWPRSVVPGTIPFEDALICWTPLSEAATHRSTAGQVEVMPFPDRTGRSDAYACHDGGAEVTDHHLTPGKAGVEALRLFNKLVLGDGMRPRVVHEAMLGIREYCLSIAPEIPGACRTAGRRRESLADDFAPQRRPL